MALFIQNARIFVLCWPKQMYGKRLEMMVYPGKLASNQTPKR